MSKLILGGDKIYIGNSQERPDYETVKCGTMPAFIPGQVIVYENDALALADASTDKTKQCFIADQIWDKGAFIGKVGEYVRGDGSYELLTTRPEQNDEFYFKITDPASFIDHATYAMTKCGLDATGTKIDVTNATELVEITAVVGETDYQMVWFRFLS